MHYDTLIPAIVGLAGGAWAVFLILTSIHQFLSGLRLEADYDLDSEGAVLSDGKFMTYREMVIMTTKFNVVKSINICFFPISMIAYALLEVI